MKLIFVRGIENKSSINHTLIPQLWAINNDIKLTLNIQLNLKMHVNKYIVNIVL